MFDIGWTELLLIGVVALIVVGPKDLPGMFRTFGRVTGRMRSMAREFQRAMEQAADESGVKDAASDLRMAASAKRLGFDRLQESALRFQDSFKENRSASGLSQSAGGGSGAADGGAAPPKRDQEVSSPAASAEGDSAADMQIPETAGAEPQGSGADARK